MKKILSILLLVTVTVALVAAPAIAKGGPAGNQNSNDGVNGNQNQNMHQNKGANTQNQHQSRARNGQLAGYWNTNGNAGHVLLVEKDSDWEVVNGSWGIFTYHVLKDTVDEMVIWGVFNAHDLEPGSEYDLIHYSDPWPGTGSIELGDGTVDEDGNLKIYVWPAVDLGNPYHDPENENDPYDGYKIWLVPEDDYDDEQNEMVDWNPEEYLFEYDLIP